MPEGPEGTGTETDQAGQTEEQPNGSPGQEQGSQTEGETSGDDSGLQDQVKHWKEMARKNEQRAKENAQAAKKLREIEDANKTELQRAQERAAEAERLAVESQAKHSRVMAAAMHDLPVDLIDILGSGTEEEINERAEAISQAINTRANDLAKRTVESLGLAWPGNNGGTPGSAPSAYGAAVAAGMAPTRPVESMRPGASPSNGGAPVTREGMFRDMIGQ